MNEACDLELLDASVHGELDARASLRLDEHLAGCASCKAELAMLQRERALFAERAARMQGSTDALWDGVAAQLAPPRSSRVAVWAGGLVATAAALLLVVRFAGPLVPADYGASVSAPSLGSPAAPGATRPVAGDEGLRALPSEGSHWRFDTGPTPRIDVDVVAGSVEIAAGDQAHVEVGATITHGVYFELTSEKAKLHVWTDRTIDRQWKIAVYQEGDAVKIRAFCGALSCGDAPSVRFQVKVPRQARLQLRSVSADVSATGLRGAAELETVSGDVRLEGADPVKVHTTSGDVRVERAAGGKAELVTTSGAVSWTGHCAEGCALGVKTISGDVELKPDATSRFQADFKTVSGDRSGEAAPGGPGSIAVSTVSGDLSVAR